VLTEKELLKDFEIKKKDAYINLLETELKIYITTYCALCEQNTEVSNCESSLKSEIEELKKDIENRRIDLVSSELEIEELKNTIKSLKEGNKR